jgi:hypothetical protein
MHNLFHKFVDFLDEANQVRLYVYAIAADSIETIKGDVVAGRLMYSLATDGSSDEEDKFFPIIITHEDVHTGLRTVLYFFCYYQRRTLIETEMFLHL